MKAKYLTIVPVLLALASCQRLELADPSGDPYASADAVWPLTLQATKSAAGTKALNLTGDYLSSYWKISEKVYVYHGSATPLAELTVAPGVGERPASATLSGEVTGLNSGDQLTLMIPRSTWDYTGQSGTLTGTGSIEEKYDYALATVHFNYYQTAAANFLNQQSIYRFSFTTGSGSLDPQDFTVSAAGGKLVQSMSYEGSAWTPAYGSLTVTPASAPGDHNYYVSLRNESIADDTYSFVITGTDHALYLAAKTISASVLDAPGRFVSAGITASRPDFAPAETSTIGTAEGVY